MQRHDRLEIARDCYRADETRDRSLIDRHLSDDFAFSSPLDVGLDRERYFERCWANAGQIASFDFVRLVEVDDEVLAAGS